MEAGEDDRFRSGSPHPVVKPSGSASRIQLTPSGSSSRLMMRRRSTAGADDPELTNSMGHSLNSKTRGGMATMGMTTKTVSQMAPPSRLKLKVTEDVMLAINERLAKGALRPSSPFGGLRSPTSKGMGWGRSKSAKRPATLQDQVDAFIEITCGDITQKDVMLVQRGPPKPWYLLSPNSTNRLRWDMFMLVILTWAAFTIPYRIAFNLDANEESSFVYWDSVVNAIFLLDVIVNFLTSYNDQSVMVIEPKKIAMRYLRTWFVLDFISSLPLDSGKQRSSTYINTVRVIRMCKLVRLIRYAGYFEAKADAMYISATLVRLANLLGFIIWFWHVVACGYWYISVQSDLSTSNWALANSVDTEATQWINYLKSVEWALQTTFSYAPQSPSETKLQAYFTIFSVIGGVVMTSVIIGSASSALQSLDGEKEVRRQRMDKVMGYLQRRKIPQYFQKVVLDYYAYMSEKLSQDAIVQELPVTIQARMSLLLNRELLKYMPGLHTLDLNSIVSLMQSLYSRIYLPGEFVFKVGDAGLYLFFIKTGACEIVLPDGKNVACNLVMGEIAGQVALVNDTNHDFSLRASAFSEVLFLEKDIYHEIAAESERFAEYVETEAIKQEQIFRAAVANLSRFSKLHRAQTASDLAAEEKHKRKLITKVATKVASLHAFTMKPKPAAAAAAPATPKPSLAAVVAAMKQAQMGEAGNDPEGA